MKNEKDFSYENFFNKIETLKFILSSINSFFCTLKLQNYKQINAAGTCNCFTRYKNFILY